MANGDIEFLQQCNLELLLAVKSSTLYADEKEQELEVAKKRLAELEAAFESDRNSIIMTKKAYSVRFEINHEDTDIIM